MAIIRDKLKVWVRVVLLLAVVAVEVACWYSLYVSFQQQKAIEMQTKVEATITGIESSYSKGKGFVYYPVYEYKSENGILYRGKIIDLSRRLSELEGRIGEKVMIYIDGNGNSILVGAKPVYAPQIIFGIIFGLVMLFLLYDFFWPDSLRKKHNSSKNKRRR